MRALVIVFLFISTSSILFAGHTHSVLHLRLSNQTPFHIILDNQPINGLSNAYILPEIEPGKHLLKIIQKDPHWQAYDKVVYHGYVDIAPAKEIFAFIDDLHRFRVHHEYALVPNISDPYAHHSYNNPYQMPVPPSHHPHAYNEAWEPTPPAPAYPYPPHHNGHSGHCTPPPPPPCAGAVAEVVPVPVPVTPAYMSNADFDQLKRVLRAKSFDSAKLKIAQQALNNNWVNTQQVKELMELLTFESYRLELAQYAYERTIDAQNYFHVFEAFTFNNSIERLKNYIEKV